MTGEYPARHVLIDRMKPTGSGYAHEVIRTGRFVSETNRPPTDPTEQERHMKQRHRLVDRHVELS
jgi:hypothetical protein